MLSSLKYQLVNKIEKIPKLQIFIYNLLFHFTFLLPHEKDYHALKLLFKKNEKNAFLDIGGNIGLSTLGWRALGFLSNKIFIFEPDSFLINKYLLKIRSKVNRIFICPFGLSNKKASKKMYMAFYKNKYFHFNNSFSKKYILEKLKNNYPEKHKEFKIIQKNLELKKFDELKFKSKVSFIKIDVEGYDHKVVEGMSKLIKKDKPVILIEYNISNFAIIHNMLQKYYNCHIFDIDKKNFKRLTNVEIKLLIKGKIFESTYVKNSVNIFFIKKNFNFY